MTKVQLLLSSVNHSQTQTELDYPKGKSAEFSSFSAWVRDVLTFRNFEMMHKILRLQIPCGPDH